MQNKNNQIRDILESDIGVIVKIVGLTVAVLLFIVVPIYKLQTDIELIHKDIQVIQTNELVHVQAILDEGKEERAEMKECIKNLEEQMIQIKVLLEK